MRNIFEKIKKIYDIYVIRLPGTSTVPLDRWACLESRNMSGYRTEGKTLDMVMDTKGHLEERLDGYRKSYE